MQHHTRHYINGQWQTAQGTDTHEVHDSSTGEVIASIPSGLAQEAEQAIEAAAAAWPAWSATPPAERAQWLERIAQGLQAREEALTQAITAEVGMPIVQTRRIQVQSPIAVVQEYANILRQGFAWEERSGNALIVQEAVGVVVAITPWNYPLSQIVLKVAPALAAGCTVVLKPSEVAPLNALILAEAIHEAGLPAGVFNLVNGRGDVVGETLVRHPQTNMVSFTGSTRAGKRVAELASQGVKRVALELGGKSASVVLRGANLEKAIKASVGECMLNTGQTCSAHTRLIVHEDDYPAIVPLLQTAISRLSVGSAWRDDVRLGPLISAAQQARVQQYLQVAQDDGDELIARSEAGVADAPQGGYFVWPHAFKVRPDSRIAREEVFGPVLAVLTYRDTDEAVALANDTDYGLGGAVWAASDDEAIAVARRIRTGQIHINGGAFNRSAPFGGFKQSGYGREGGVHGLQEFLEAKALLLPQA